MADIIRKKERKNWFYSYNMIFDLDISEHAKIVYLYLCRCADSEGQAFPSYSTIAEKCSIGRRTAIKAVKELLAVGLLSVEQRTREDGSLTSNLYTIHDEPQGVDSACETPPSAPGAPPLVHVVHHPSAPRAPEGLPNEGQNNLKDNNIKADNCKKENTTCTEKNDASVVVGKNEKNTVKASLCSSVEDDSNKKATSSKEEIAKKIKELTGSKIARKVLEELSAENLEKAIRVYEEKSKKQHIYSPVGYIVSLAREGAELPRPAGSQRIAFCDFEQHDWDPAQLEALWEPIG